MPRLPPIWSREAPGPIGIPFIERRPPPIQNTGPMQFVGAVSDFAQAVYGSVLGSQAQSASQAVSKFNIGLKQTEVDLEGEADHSNYLDLWRERVGKLKSDAEGKVQNFFNPVQQPAMRKLGEDFQLADIGAQKKQAKLAVEHDRAGLITSLDQLAGLAARADTPEARFDWQQRGFENIERMRGRSLTEPEAATTVINFRNRIQSSRVEYFTTELQNRLDDFTNKALRVPDNAADFQREGTQLIESAGSDWLPPEKIQEVKSNYANSVWSAAVQGKTERDPNATLKELKSGKYDAALNQRSLLALRDEARVEIDRRERKAEAERKAQDKIVGQLVSDYKDAKISGFDWRGPVSEAQLERMAKGTEHDIEFQNVRAASKVLGDFNLLAPVDQEQYLRQVRSGAKTGVEAKFVGTLERAAEATKTGLKTDPLTFAVKQRLIPAPPPLNLDDPATLRERARLATIAESRYGVPVSPLSDDEAGRLKTVLDQSPPDVQMLILRKVRAGLPDHNVKSVAAQLTKKGDSVLALSMGLSVDAPQAASDILQGRSILKENPKIAPVGADMEAARLRINQILGEAFMHNPEHHAAVSEAALAIYAQKSWQEKDLSGVLHSSRLDASVKEATGGLLTVGRNFLGFGGYKIQPPRYGMNESDFKTLLDKADFSAAKGVSKKDILGGGIFESVGDGKYLIRLGPGYIQGDRGPLVLDLGQTPPRGLITR